jgi:hypothetical protein
LKLLVCPLVGVFRFSARPLGIIITSPHEVSATTKAIEYYFHVEPAHQFRVVVTKLDKIKGKTAPAS